MRAEPVDLLLGATRIEPAVAEPETQPEIGAARPRKQPSVTREPAPWFVVPQCDDGRAHRRSHVAAHREAPQDPRRIDEARCPGDGARCAVRADDEIAMKHPMIVERDAAAI